MSRSPDITRSTFNAHDVPLSGWNLVEASAGTGKTYALAGLYVRLLIEKGLSVKEILVVTFTKAATNELKTRIRARIKDAVGAFTGGAVADPFLAGLVSSVENHERARRLLTDALRSFDESAIFTIHGFCLRALHNHAFESGSLFDMEFVEDETETVKEMIHDFWRINFYRGSGQLFSCIRPQIDPEQLLKLVRLCGRNPFLRVDGEKYEDQEAVPRAAEQACFCAFSEAATSWGASRSEIRDILAQDAAFSRSIYTQKAVDRVIQVLDTYFSSDYFLPSPNELDYLCFDPPVKPTALKKKSQPPGHPFFGQCELLRRRLGETSSCYERKLVEMRQELIDFVKRRSAEKKLERNVRTFSDLLLDLHGALEAQGGKELAVSLRKQYKAALIDEFQDTDPIQYAIFKRIYGYEDGTLFLIGDPKQAIFGFRGADLFAYIRASNDVARRFTLDRNWRSSEPLIRAVNAIFDRAESPFLLEQVEYVPVKDSGAASVALTIDGATDHSPLKLWFVTRSPEGKSVTKGAAREKLYRAVCSEIRSLLESGQGHKAVLGDRPVASGDIAVIVRTNREAYEMQSALRQVNIPSVVYTGETVFRTAEALETEQILQAVSDPIDESKVKVALATKMLGVSGDDLANLIENEVAWQTWLTRFHEYRLLWLRSGLVSMARTLVAREQVKQRLASFPDGERRLTNLLHLLELLHRAAVEEKLGMEGLLKWLGERRQLVNTGAAEIPPEEHQIRLETDEMAVKIVTIHKSKGLEYPIVFCPFLWGDSRITESVITYHDKEDDYQSVVDVSVNPDEATRGCAEAEQLAENIRLTYVALTRAMCRCYVAWGYINESETSALAYLLHGGGLERCDLAALEAHMKKTSDEVLMGELEAIVKKSHGAIEIVAVPEERSLLHYVSQPGLQLVRPKLFTGKIELDWRVSSFSALASGHDESSDFPEHDTQVQEELLSAGAIEQGQAARSLSIFTFPAGPTAGTCLHDIFEQLDFVTFESDETRTLVSGILDRYGFTSEWVDTICGLIKNVLTTPLNEGSSFALAALEQGDRLHEVEFHLPLSLITPKGLGTLFDLKGDTEVSSIGSRIKRLGFKPVKGMLKGFLDLVFRRGDRFCIVDWKSNYLGPAMSDYSAERLSKVMDKQLYTLQSHIYAVALHRFLELRLPGYKYESHFGGVYYLFLRGMNPEGGSGILFDRPSPDFINNLTKYITV
jgi:exodeoxyribonuclease V beta subunit